VHQPRPSPPGSSGAQVTALQQFLQSQGYFTATPTGYYGQLTAQAVAAFQSANNLAAVGSVGPQTQSLLNSATEGKVLGASTTAFAIGDAVQTTAKLNVRATPSTKGKLLGTEAKGAQGAIIGGPTIANGYTWWDIAFSNHVTGWSVQSYLKVVAAPVAPPAPTAALSASPPSITSGQSSTLTWSSTNATSCTGTKFTASGTSGTVSVAPTINTTYSIICAGPGGTASQSATVTVATSTGDTIPPSVPTNLSASAVSSSQINLTWTASTDNVGVAGYDIYRNGTKLGTSATNSYRDTGLSASTQYTYTVSAYDAAGNTSAPSSAASATTQTAPQGGGTPSAGPSTPLLGNNLNDVNYYTPEQPFLNILKTGGGWGATDATGNRWDESQDVFQLDANGYPTSMQGTGPAAGITFPEIDTSALTLNVSPGGTYVLLYDGTGTITLLGQTLISNSPVESFLISLPTAADFVSGSPRPTRITPAITCATSASCIAPIRPQPQ
jgi:peptidoglycan hydrolase-like protein with peptidoglycan-binding domain